MIDEFIAVPVAATAAATDDDSGGTQYEITRL